MIWDSHQYWNKAKLYAKRATEDGRSPWENPFWSVLALEFLARSALTKIHPVLNADPQNEANLFYAVGLEIIGQPKSIPIHAVLGRVEKAVPGFDKPLKEFCDFFVMVRNREFHTSELAFEGLSEKEWLPRYYKACKVLCEFLGQKLEDLFSEEMAKAAQRLIDALDSNKRAQVKKAIAAHETVFNSKPEDQKIQLQKQQDLISKTWVGEYSGAPCPACKSLGRLHGYLERESEPMFSEGMLFVEKTYLADNFQCDACGLVLKDIEEIHQGGIDPHFKKFVQTDLHAYFEPEYYEEYQNM